MIKFKRWEKIMIRNNNKDILVERTFLTYIDWAKLPFSAVVSWGGEKFNNWPEEIIYNK